MSSLSTPAPELPLEATEAAFFSIVEEIAPGIQVTPGCKQLLRQMINAGLKKMRDEERDKPPDIIHARGSLATFVLEMKQRARTRGQSDYLNEDTARETAEYFLSMQITFWPFIPPPWSVS